MSPDGRPDEPREREADLPWLPRLAEVVAAAAVGSGAALALALEAAIGDGVPLSRMREALLMLAPFGGFPRALDALEAFAVACARAGVVAPAEPDTGPAEPEKGDGPQFRARGRAFFDRVYGAAADRVLDRIRTLDPDVPGWVLESAYGRVLSRPGLSAATRECLAVVLLTALQLPNQLRGHVRGAVACGATEEDVRAALSAAGDLLPSELVQAALASLAEISPPQPGD